MDPSKKWRITAENAIGCHEGKELGERECRKCDNLEYCLNYHEETMAAICTFIADLIDGSSEEVTKELSERIKAASEKIMNNEESEESVINNAGDMYL